jgi:hypothetical protein
MLQDVEIPIDFGGGQDTKTDPKKVLPNKFQLIQNGIFTNTHRITKRNGYDNVSLNEFGTNGVISNLKMVKAYKDQMICVGTGALNQPAVYSYSQNYGAWKQAGVHSDIKVSSQEVNSSEYAPASFTAGTVPQTFGIANSSTVVIGNIALTAFDRAGVAYGYNAGNNGTDATYITVTDLSTGTILKDQFAIRNGTGFSKAAILGTSTFAVFFISSASSNRLSVVVVTVTANGGVSVGSEVTIGSCAAKSDLTKQFPYTYDYVTTSTGAIVSVANQPNINLYKIDTTGATTATATLSSTGDITPINSTLDASGNVWVYWGSAGTNLYYAIRSSTLSAVLAPTLVKAVTPVIPGAAIYISQCHGRNTTTNNQVAYYSTHETDNAMVCRSIFANTAKISVDNIGTIGTTQPFCQSIALYAKSFQLNSNQSFVPCVGLSQTNATCFLVDSTFNSIAKAKFFQDRSEGIYAYGYNVAASAVNPVIYGIRYPGFLNVPQQASSSIFYLGAGAVVSIQNKALTSSSDGACYPQEIPIGVVLSAHIVTFDFNNIDANQALIQQDTAVINGAIMSIYDGSQCVELGYNIDPDNITLGSASGGSVAAGTYTYYITWEWLDAMGNLYISAPSQPATVFFSSSGNEVQVYAKSLNLTQKQNQVVKIWRSSSNLGGNLAYLLYQETFTSPGLISYLDKLADATISSGPTLYTQNGAVLENIAPPPAMIMWANNNRIWCVDSQSPETNIEYCKTGSNGTGICFSTGSLELVIDSKGGEITAGSPLDEKTIVLKENGLGYFIGDGANDSGAGSSITNFQFIPSDVGCTNSKSVILYPNGILFRTTKGIYQLSRGLATSYFGYEVEAYNSQDIQSAFIVPTKNQIRFLTSSGSSLLYDYVMNQWSVFTNHAGLSADTFQNAYVYVRADGSLYSENTTSFLDNLTSYALALQTGWLALSSVQNFERVRYMLTLGDYQNGSSTRHGLQIQAAYDFSPTFGSAQPYYFGASSGSGIFQYRNFFRQQKCDAISLLITEITNSVSGEYIDLTNMSFCAALKKGLNKVTVGASVG